MVSTFQIKKILKRGYVTYVMALVENKTGQVVEVSNASSNSKGI